MEPATMTANLGSAADLARMLGRSRQGTKKALLRTGIQPVQSVGTITLYDMSAALPALSEHMRAKNKQAQP